MSWQWHNVYVNHRTLGMEWMCLCVSVTATFTWLGVPGCSCHPCIHPDPRKRKQNIPVLYSPSPTHWEFKGHLFWHGAALHAPIPIQETVARVWEGWRLLNGGEEMDQEKDTETKMEWRFRCSPTGIREVWSGSGTAVSPGYSDTPAATRIPGWNSGVERACSSSEPVPAQINVSKPAWSVPQRCMHEQAPSQSHRSLKGVWLPFKCKRTQRVPGYNIPSFNKGWECSKHLRDESWNDYHLESNTLHSSLWMPNVLTQTEIKSSLLIEEQVTEYSERRKQTNKFSSGIRGFHLLQLSMFLRGEMFLKLNHFPPLFDHFQIPKMSPKKWLFAQSCTEKSKANKKKAPSSGHTSVICLFSSKIPNIFLPRDGYQLKCPIKQGFTSHPNPMAAFKCLLVNVPERLNHFRAIPSTQPKKQLGSR